MYGSEIIVWSDRETPRIRDLHIDTLRGLLGIGRIDRLLNARVIILRREERGD